MLFSEVVVWLFYFDRVFKLVRSSIRLGDVLVVEDVMKMNSFSVEVGGYGYVVLFLDVLVRVFWFVFFFG